MRPSPAPTGGVRPPRRAVFVSCLSVVLSVTFWAHPCYAAWENARLYHLHRSQGQDRAFLQEQESAGGRSETHVANMLEAHLLDSIKGMVDAGGESTIVGKARGKGNSMLSGQGAGALHGKGRGSSATKGRGREKAAGAEQAGAAGDARLHMESHAQTWAKTQAQAMAKAATAQQAKETARLQTEAALAAHDEMKVLTQLQMDMHHAQKATAASLPKLELNPRLNRGAPRLLTEDEKLLAMLKHPERYVDARHDIDGGKHGHPTYTFSAAIAARPSAPTGKKMPATSPPSTVPPVVDKAKLLAEQQDAVAAAAPRASRTDGNSSRRSVVVEPAHKPVGHLPPHRHVMKALKEHHVAKNMTIAAAKKAAHSTMPSAFMDLASFLDLGVPLMERTPKAKSTTTHFRNKHVVHRHKAAPSFWPQKRSIGKRTPPPLPRFSEELQEVSDSALANVAKEAFRHPFWNSRPAKQEHEWPSGMGHSSHSDQRPVAPQRPPPSQQQPTPQRPRTIDDPFGANDVNAPAVPVMETPRQPPAAGGLEGAANGGLPSMATSAKRPPDPRAPNGVGPSGGNPFAGSMAPPSAVQYEYGSKGQVGVPTAGGRRPPPPPPAAPLPPPPVGQGSNAMPMPMVQMPGAAGPHPTDNSHGGKGGVDSSFLPPPPLTPMSPQQAGSAPRAGGVMAPSVVTTVPFGRGRL